MTTANARAWTKVREAYMAHVHLRSNARALGKVARTHGLTLRQVQSRARREGWKAEADTNRIRKNLDTSTRWVADGVETARRELAGLDPRLSVDVNDPKAVRRFAEATYRAGTALSQLYGVLAWYVETRHEALQAAGKSAGAWRPWPPGFPKMAPAPWSDAPKRSR